MLVLFDRTFVFRLPWYIISSMQIELFCGAFQIKLQTTHIFLMATTGRRSTERSLELCLVKLSQTDVLPTGPRMLMPWLVLYLEAACPLNLLFIVMYKGLVTCLYTRRDFFTYHLVGMCLSNDCVCWCWKKTLLAKKYDFFIALSVWHK